MFQLSVMTDEISQDFDRAIQVCQEYELPLVELRSVWEKPPQDLANDEDMGKMKAVLDAAGMGVSCIASPFLKCDLGNADQYAENLDILRNCIKLAHFFDCRIIRGFTFWRTGGPDTVWQQLLDAYDEPVKILEAEDCYIGIENESSTHIGSAAELQRFLGDLNTPRVAAIWDAANEVYAEGGELPFPDAFNRVRDKIIHVHIKDAVKVEDGEAECVPVGEGGYIDYPAQFQELIDMGYDGAVSLETHWRPVALSEDILNRPGGSAFSESGEQASRICLANIKRMLADLRV